MRREPEAEGVIADETLLSWCCLVFAAPGVASLHAIHFRRKWELDKNTCDAYRKEPVGRLELRVAGGRAGTGDAAAWRGSERDE
jgi:hypothetical protein